jgi:hypothetical protein
MAKDQIGYNNRNDLIKQLKLRLGDGMVDVELDNEHYHTAIDLAMGTYRRLSSGSVEQSYLALEIQAEVQEYTLPGEVTDISRLFRRQLTGNGGMVDNGNVIFDPIYGVYPGMGGAGSALTDIAIMGMYLETASYILASEYDFLWNTNTRVLKILRKIVADETVLVEVENFIPESHLLKGIYTADWLAKWAMSECKLMLGAARGKYATGLPGPGGTVQLDGDTLRAEGQQEQAELKQALHNMEEGNRPLGFIIG